MAWKYDCRCGHGLLETGMHVLFECTIFEGERWRRKKRDLGGMDEYAIIIACEK